MAYSREWAYDIARRWASVGPRAQDLDREYEEAVIRYREQGGLQRTHGALHALSYVVANATDKESAATALWRRIKRLAARGRWFEPEFAECMDELLEYDITNGHPSTWTQPELNLQSLQ